jgi:PAS domain S-box-containing protein
VPDGFVRPEGKVVSNARAEAPRSAVFNPLIDALPVAVFATDAADRLTGYNWAAARLWRRSPQLGAHAWESFGSLFTPDGRTLAGRELTRVSEHDLTEGIEALAVRPDGSQVPFLAFPTPLRDTAGKVTGVITMLVDLSDRKQIERSLVRRIEEQKVMFRLANRLQHAGTIDEAYEAALDAILCTLQCTRASILLFDDAGVMRFQAWRGLSPEYRAAVEGHSPWTRDTRDPQPISISAVADAELAPGLRQTILREGIAALAFVPLMADAKLTGKFMVYFDAPHEFSEDELECAQMIGRQVGFSIERMRVDAARRRAEEDLRLSEQRLNFALEAGCMGAWEWNIKQGKVIWSPLVEKLHGIEPGSFGGTFDEFRRDIHPDDQEKVLRTIERVLETGEDYSLTYRIVRPDGEVRWLQARGKLVGEPGRPEKLAGICTDVTERQLAEERIGILMREVNHRSKNLLALVQAVAKHTAASRPDDFVKCFSDRLRGLAASQDLLIQGGWRGIEMDALVRSQLAHFNDLIGTRIKVAGPALRISASAAQSIGMALHELATNAGKYGALSNTNGAVACDWELKHERSEPTFAIRWIESGGPAVESPDRQGFGHTVVCSMAKLALGADVDLDFAPAGLRWHLRCAAASALEPKEGIGS